MFDLLRQFNRKQGATVLFVTPTAAQAQSCDRTTETIDGQVT